MCDGSLKGGGGEAGDRFCHSSSFRLYNLQTTGNQSCPKTLCTFQLLGVGMTTYLPGSNYSSPVRSKAGDSRNQKSRTEVHGEARVPWPASPRLLPTRGRAGICKTLCLALGLGRPKIDRWALPQLV
jgi:hypothetical protein